MTARRRFTATVAVAVALSTAGCATNGLASLPLPHPGLSEGGYTLTAIFENALNVPALAKVRLAGADVGQLESLDAKDYTAVATCVSPTACSCPRAARSNCVLRHHSAMSSSPSSRLPMLPPTGRCSGRRHHRTGEHRRSRHCREPADRGGRAGERRCGAEPHRPHQRRRKGGRRNGGGTSAG